MGLGKLEKRVGFIGAGQMAEALARGFIARGVVKASDMVATDPVEARRKVFESFSVKPVISNAEVLFCLSLQLGASDAPRLDTTCPVSMDEHPGCACAMITLHVVRRLSRKRTSFS